MTYEIEGMDELEEQLRIFLEAHREELSDILYREAWEVMRESKKECPVDTGRLRTSGLVLDPVVGGDNIETSLGYYTDYAVYVHENLEARHLPPTKAKFLEDPITRNFAEVQRAIEDKVNELLGADIAGG